MPRNLFRRIEVVFPIVDGILRERVISEILATTLADNTKARLLFADGTYHRAPRSEADAPRRSQTEFITLAMTGRVRKNPAAKKRNKYPRVQLAPSPFKK